MAGIKTTEDRSFLTEKLPMFIAITTVVLAVCTTLASFKAAGYGNRMVLAQNQASDQWAYYQAKSIKETTYQVQRDALSVAMQQASQPEAYAAKIADYDKELTRYRQEKNEIQNEAKRLENERDVAQGFNSRFGQAMIFLQIGILLASLASINKVRYYWYMSLVSGGAGIVLFFHTLYQAL
ncbi:MAG: DUF4337 domain-containing protein [Negativicutes bacterium]|nr:DUF4337 domain-containing protein [Negativicutes bacterium]